MRALAQLQHAVGESAVTLENEGLESHAGWPFSAEGFRRESPHPTPLRGATFSHKWEKDARR